MKSLLRFIAFFTMHLSLQFYVAPYAAQVSLERAFGEGGVGFAGFLIEWTGSLLMLPLALPMYSYWPYIYSSFPLVWLPFILNSVIWAAIGMIFYIWLDNKLLHFKNLVRRIERKRAGRS